MKHKKHRFVVTVKNDGTKKSAKYSLLAAFAVRQPDGCEFTVSEERKKLLKLEKEPVLL